MKNEEGLKNCMYWVMFVVPELSKTGVLGVFMSIFALFLLMLFSFRCLRLRSHNNDYL